MKFWEELLCQYKIVPLCCATIIRVWAATREKKKKNVSILELVCNALHNSYKRYETVDSRRAPRAGINISIESEYPLRSTFYVYQSTVAVVGE